MGGVPIFRIPKATLQLDGLHLQLLMSSRFTISSSSQLSNHGCHMDLWPFLSFKKTYGTSEKSLFTLSHLQQIGGKPILILKNNSCFYSLDEKEWS